MEPTLRDALLAWLADDEAREAALLSAGYQGSAYLYETGAHKLVVKRAGGGPLGRLHRRALRREAAAYERLAGIEGVPRSLGLLDNRWLALEFVDGESYTDARHTLSDRDAFFDRLRSVIDAMHAAGVAHGDLKRKENVLVTPGERPCIIDFGTAVMRDGSLPDRLLFRLIRRFDNNAWIKRKYDRDYAAVSAADLHWYRPTLLERWFSSLQKFWRTVTFRQARKRRRNRDELSE